MEEKLLHASEARRIINEGDDAVSKEYKKKITSLVNEAVRNGKCKVSVEIRPDFHDRIGRWLKTSGYKVRSGSSQRDGSWFYIEW